MISTLFFQFPVDTTKYGGNTLNIFITEWNIFYIRLAITPNSLFCEEENWTKATSLNSNFRIPFDLVSC